MPGKFVVQKGKTEKFRFSLLSPNGQIVASSQVYNSKASCMNGIKSVRSLAVAAEVEDQTTRQWAAEQKAKATAKGAPAAKAASKKAKPVKSADTAAPVKTTAPRKAPAKRAAAKKSAR